MFSTERKFTSARQLTSYITKTLKDAGFQRYQKFSGENTATPYLAEKTFINGTSYIVIGGVKDKEEIREIKANLETFFDNLFGKGKQCVSKEIRETYTKGGQTWVSMHKKMLGVEDLATVRYDIVIYKNWTYYKFDI